MPKTLGFGLSPGLHVPPGWVRTGGLALLLRFSSERLTPRPSAPTHPALPSELLAERERESPW